MRMNKNPKRIISILKGLPEEIRKDYKAEIISIFVSHDGENRKKLEIWIFS